MPLLPPIISSSPRPYPFQHVLDLNPDDQPARLPVTTRHSLTRRSTPSSLPTTQSPTNPLPNPSEPLCFHLTTPQKRQYKPKNKHHHEYTAAQKQHREKVFLFSLLALLLLVTLIAAFLALWRRRLRRKRARRIGNKTMKGKENGPASMWPNLRVGPTTRVTQFDESEVGRGRDGNWSEDDSCERIEADEEWNGNADGYRADHVDSVSRQAQDGDEEDRERERSGSDEYE